MFLKIHSSYEEDMEKMVGIAFQAIQIHFTKSSSNNPPGTALLTATSTYIGTKICEFVDRKAEWKIKVRLGDLFIEAFYNCKFVNIYYEQRADSCYILQATTRWTELKDIPSTVARINIIATTTTKPKNLNNYIQKCNNLRLSVIKDREDKIDLESIWAKSINKIQQTGWRINQKIYDIMIKNKDFFISEEEVVDNKAKELKRRSKIIEWEFIMTKAEKLYNEDVFYQYIEADYRGRIYYSEPFLNYQGSDWARGMLEFAEQKPLTQEGNFWLAVHTANSYNEVYNKNEIPTWCQADYKSYLISEGLESISVDKMTLEDRAMWTRQNKETILEAGKIGHLFPEAEKSITFLACCIEWYNISQCTAVYYSRLPIPIDGSNNGWQHLGAISKDKSTGILVGLIPTEIQEDFYVKTAKKLYEITTDVERKELLEVMPMKDIRKGITKRGSMTRAYSAGATKIAENMWFDCKAEDFHEIYDLTEDHCKGFAKDLIKAIDQVCPGPLDTMKYMQDLATYELGKYDKFLDDTIANTEYKKILTEIKSLWIKKKELDDDQLKHLSELVKSLDKYEVRLTYGNGSKNLSWTTPSGFPVLYECPIYYSQKETGTISGYKKKTGESKSIRHVARVATKQPDIRGFICGISPNFIHSIDASHMALVINEWHGSFGAVHDSFSTHACDVEDLLEITKRTFVDLYNVDNFYNYIRKELTNNTDDIEQPTLGDLNIREVNNSDYFFS